jgi:hypothetical protein
MPPLAANGPVAVVFSPVGAGFGEVENFDHDGMSAVLFSGTDDAGDGCPQVPVACGRRQSGQVEIDGGGGTENVAVWSDDSDREMAMVYTSVWRFWRRVGQMSDKAMRTLYRYRKAAVSRAQGQSGFLAGIVRMVEWTATSGFATSNGPIQAPGVLNDLGVA